MARLEEKVDEVEAYKRMDAVVISGNALPEVTMSENVNHLAWCIVQEKLELSLDSSEVSATHHLRPKLQNQSINKRNFIFQVVQDGAKK